MKILFTLDYTEEDKLLAKYLLAITDDNDRIDWNKARLQAFTLKKYMKSQAGAAESKGTDSNDTMSKAMQLALWISCVLQYKKTKNVHDISSALHRLGHNALCYTPVIKGRIVRLGNMADFLSVDDTISLLIQFPDLAFTEDKIVAPYLERIPADTELENNADSDRFVRVLLDVFDKEAELDDKIERAEIFFSYFEGVFDYVKTHAAKLASHYSWFTEIVPLSVIGEEPSHEEDEGVRAGPVSVSSRHVIFSIEQLIDKTNMFFRDNSDRNIGLDEYDNLLLDLFVHTKLDDWLRYLCWVIQNQESYLPFKAYLASCLIALKLYKKSFFKSAFVIKLAKQSKIVKWVGSYNNMVFLVDSWCRYSTQDLAVEGGVVNDAEYFKRELDFLYSLLTNCNISLEQCQDNIKILQDWLSQCANDDCYYALDAVSKLNLGGVKRQQVLKSSALVKKLSERGAFPPFSDELKKLVSCESQYEHSIFGKQSNAYNYLSKILRSFSKEKFAKLIVAFGELVSHEQLGCLSDDIIWSRLTSVLYCSLVVALKEKHTKRILITVKACLNFYESDADWLTDMLKVIHSAQAYHHDGVYSDVVSSLLNDSTIPVEQQEFLKTNETWVLIQRDSVAVNEKEAYLTLCNNMLQSHFSTYEEMSVKSQQCINTAMFLLAVLRARHDLLAKLNFDNGFDAAMLQVLDPKARQDVSALRCDYGELFVTAEYKADEIEPAAMAKQLLMQNGASTTLSQFSLSFLKKGDFLEALFVVMNEIISTGKNPYYAGRLASVSDKLAANYHHKSWDRNAVLLYCQEIIRHYKPSREYIARMQDELNKATSGFGSIFNSSSTDYVNRTRAHYNGFCQFIKDMPAESFSAQTLASYLFNHPAPAIDGSSVRINYSCALLNLCIGVISGGIAIYALKPYDPSAVNKYELITVEEHVLWPYPSAPEKTPDRPIASAPDISGLKVEEITLEPDRDDPPVAVAAGFGNAAGGPA